MVWEGEEGVRHLGEGIRAQRDGYGMGTGHTFVANLTTATTSSRQLSQLVLG